MITWIVIYILSIGYMAGAMCRMSNSGQHFTFIEMIGICIAAPFFVAISIGYLVEHLSRK